MHGRVKVRTSAEQQEAKKKEQAKKLAAYQNAMTKIFTKRSSGEQDHEQLAIAGSVLQMNPDVYTLWNIRKEVLEKFKLELSTEDFDSLLIEDLRLTEQCLKVNPKSYGVWHHRTWVLNSMTNPRWDLEIKLCNRALELDERNFHCWDFRRFVAAKAGVPNEDELKFSTEKVSGNFSNYSAWHYRSELLPRIHPSPQSSRPDSAVIKRELQLVQNAMFTDPNDQSAFFYHRWLLGRKEPELSLSKLQATVAEGKLKVAISTSSVCQREVVSVTVDGTAVEWDWASPSGRYSDIWVTTQEGMEKPVSISVTVGGVTLSFLASRDMETVKMTGENYQVHLAQTEVDKETLNSELSSLQQLRELEPNNKWVLLTCALLLRATKPCVDSTVLEILENLKQIDPYRRSYYDDLKSCMLLDDHLLQSVSSNSLNCRSVGLTSVSHLSHLTFIEEVDFSGNQLKNMTFAKHLVFTKKLILSSNMIEEVSDVNDALEELDVSNNRIRSFKGVGNLKILKIGGNPCSVADVKGMFPIISVLE